MLAPLLSDIKEFCQVNNLQADSFQTSGSREQLQIVVQKDVDCGPLTESELMTYTLFQEKNMSLTSISERRSLPLTVVGTHLYQAMKADFPVDLERAGLTPVVQESITKVIQTPPIYSDVTRIKAIRALVPENIELYLIRMTIALLEKGYGRKQLDQQCFSSQKRPSAECEDVKSSPESSLHSKKEVLWIETKGNSVKATTHGVSYASNERTEQDNPCTDSSALVNSSKTDDKQPPPARPEVLSHQSSIRLASWNQLSLNPEEEELFTDSQSQILNQSSKRKLPQWFGTSEGNVPSVNIAKKSKVGAKKGLFS
uniref:Helicase Helix-turn-helix domain-containing protein n=1 Tax=Sphenodon punctatus TaxID=8508 RepID=A0A8D0HN34_SPHPU